MLTSVEQDVAQLLAFLKHIPNVMYYDLVCGSLGDFVKALAAVCPSLLVGCTLSTSPPIWMWC